MRPRVIVATSGRTHFFTGIVSLVLVVGQLFGGPYWPAFGIAGSVLMAVGAIWAMVVGVRAMGHIDPRSPEPTMGRLWRAWPGWLLAAGPAVWFALRGIEPGTLRSLVAAQTVLKYAACALPPLVALASTTLAAWRFQRAAGPGHAR